MIRTLVKDHGGKAGGAFLAVGMVVSYLEARDARQEAREDAKASTKANVELHERIARLESSMTYNRGAGWTNFSTYAETLNRATRITPPASDYEIRQMKK